MSKISLINTLSEMRDSGKAMLACNFYNAETLCGILTAAREKQAPLILQLSKSSIDYLGMAVAVAMARSALQQFEVTGWLHLDHAATPELVAQALKAGFDSVMIDASEKSFAENVETTRQVVDMAAKYGAGVEAELGYVAKLGQNQGQAGFTEPQQAQDFVAATGVDLLAVAVGSAHGFYKDEPRLDLERLSAIRASTGIPLVLHGGSGIPDEMLREAVRRGICKINLATEVKNIFMKSLRQALRNNNEIDLRKVFPPAIRRVADLVGKKLETLNYGQG